MNMSHLVVDNGIPGNTCEIYPAMVLGLTSLTAIQAEPVGAPALLADDYVPHYPTLPTVDCSDVHASADSDANGLHPGSPISVSSGESRRPPLR